MNPLTCTELIDRTLLQTLETMAFMFGEAQAVPAATGESRTPLGLLGEMRFDGHRSGRVAILIPRELAGEVATNLLGLDPGEPQSGEQLVDTVKELLNVVCGQLLTALEGDRAPFQLSIPRISEAGQEVWRARALQPDARHYRIEGQPVVLIFCMDGEG
jgi:CheY-specific phosphatase CheX